MEGSGYNLMRDMNRGMWKRRQGVVGRRKERTTKTFISDTGNTPSKHLCLYEAKSDGISSIFK